MATVNKRSNSRGGLKRGAGGKFAKGTAPGPGNPHAKQTAAIREALFKALTPKELGAVVKALISAAKSGDIAAIKELLDRTLGKAVSTIEMRAAFGQPDAPQFGGLEIMIVGRDGKEHGSENRLPGPDGNGNGHRLLPGPALDGGRDLERL